MGLVVVLDTNVLWSACLRDTLLRCAEGDFFRFAWTQQIFNELAIALTVRTGRISKAQATNLVQRLEECFPDGLTEGFEHLVPEMTNHIGDRHILAAAIKAEAQVIVTHNTSHFPEKACQGFGIEVQTPDTFLCYLWKLDRERIIHILSEQAAALRNPPQTLNDILSTLSYSTPTFCDCVRSYLVRDMG